jgi:hypothetical protein
VPQSLDAETTGEAGENRENSNRIFIQAQRQTTTLKWWFVVSNG